MDEKLALIVVLVLAVGLGACSIPPCEDDHVISVVGPDGTVFFEEPCLVYSSVNHWGGQTSIRIQRCSGPDTWLVVPVGFAVFERRLTPAPYSEVSDG